MKITPIDLVVSKAFLIQAERPILVDTGKPQNARRILRALARHDVEAQDLALILLTHAHWDHAGSAQALRQLTGAAIAVHHADAAMLRQGKMNPMVPVGIEARLIEPFVLRPFPGLEADILLDAASHLTEYGFEGRILHTPGHSDGSVSFLFEDRVAIIGDILRGGYLGGRLFPHRPFPPYFMPDMKHMRMLYQSIRTVLDAGAELLYPGHGGLLYRKDVEQWLSAHTAG